MQPWWSRLRRVGPGALVAAAFIGPGTVTTCTRAGSGFGFSLLWALLISTAAVVVLQEMSGRLGAVTGKDLAQHLRARAATRSVRLLVAGLVIAAIGVGCAAFEGGNLAGAALGLQLLAPVSHDRAVLAGAVLAAYLLLRGNYRFFERALTLLVAAMGMSFLATAVLSGPALAEVVTGAFVPSLPDGSTFLVLALVGTTVVPYNLFLHSRAVTERGRPGDERLADTRLDLLLCVPLGGLVSMAIVVTAAMAFASAPGEALNPADLGAQLEPLFGEPARWMFGFGLCAAGLTSALTAPMAAAFAVCGVLGMPERAAAWPGKLVAVAVLGSGFLVNSFDLDPSDVIVGAQAANGILLPISVFFLLWVMNDARELAERRNGIWMNGLGIMTALLALFLGGRALVSLI